MKVIAIFTLLISTIGFMPSSIAKEETAMEQSKEIGQSATEWKNMYFLGISKNDPSSLNLSEGQIRGLLSMVKVGPAVSTGAAIEPSFLMNTKGVTPWLALYTLIYTKKPEALGVIARGESAINIPGSYLNGLFASHVHWPKNIISKYNLELEGYKPFIIPFMLHKDSPPVGSFTQSMKAPDGSLEIFGIHEFNESNPERLFAEVEGIIEFIKEKRPDVTATKH